MTNAHDFSFAKLNEPGEINLADYAGKAVLVVNVASACGFTPQYRDLEALYEAKAGKGLAGRARRTCAALELPQIPDRQGRRPSGKLSFQSRPARTFGLGGD